jgi:hypothetical protein
MLAGSTKIPLRFHHGRGAINHLQLASKPSKCVKSVLYPLLCLSISQLGTGAPPPPPRA